MRRILVIANNLKQASFRLRIEALIAPLARRGYELDVRLRPRSFFARRRLLASAAEYDAVILQRKLLEFYDADLLNRSAKAVFFDVDDAVMFDSPSAGRIGRWRTWRRFLATAKRVDHVVAGNAHLAELFQRHGSPATTILPTTVDPAQYLVKPTASANATSRCGSPLDTPDAEIAASADATSPCRLVWIGSRSTLRYLRQVLPALESASKIVPGLSLLTIADGTLENCPIPLEHVNWSVETEAAALIRGDIGIAPTPADPWTLGKCGFKIIQYMAAGLPTIASPVGANAEIVDEGRTGLLPQTDADWPAAIARLAGDFQLRSQMGRAGREKVEKLYSLERAVDVWAGLLGQPNHNQKIESAKNG